MKQGRGAARFFGIIQEYLFPIFCVSCEKEGNWLCDLCFQHHTISCGVFYCPVCHGITETGNVCAHCPKTYFLSRHQAIVPYSEKAIIATLLYAFKYQYAESIMSVLERYIHLFLSTNKNFSHIDAIVPVPLHKKRYAERGFNQAEKIAEVLSVSTGIPVLRGAVRQRETIQQATLSKQEREKNVDAAFLGLPAVAGKRILLVDDVFTTGSTMQECAKALRKAGAIDVEGFSLARG